MDHDQLDSLIARAELLPFANESTLATLLVNALSTTLAEQWVSSARQNDRLFLLAFVVALSLRIRPALFAVRGWGIGNPGQIGIGDPADNKIGVNGELIDTIEYESRFVSFVRCANHGGASTGPKTAVGRLHIAAAQRLRWAIERARKAAPPN